MSGIELKHSKFGLLAHEYCGKRIEVAVLRSAAGYYIGTFDEDGPVSRESNEYWPTSSAAQEALDTHCWTQKETP